MSKLSASTNTSKATTNTSKATTNTSKATTNTSKATTNTSKASKTSADSLDVLPEKNFHIKMDKGEKIFILSESLASKSKLLESIIESCTDETTEKNPLILKTITQASDIHDNVDYRINTDEMFSYVYEYLDMWKDDIDNEDYCKEEPVSTGDPLQILKSKDVIFIKKYLSSSISNIKNGKRHFYENCNLDNIEETTHTNNYIIIRIIGELLIQVEHYLEMPSLANKLFAYIGTILWNSSLVELYEASHDSHFQQLQLQAVNDWHAENHTKIDRYVPSYTTGNGKENQENM